MTAPSLFDDHIATAMRTPPGEPPRRALPSWYRADVTPDVRARRDDEDTSHEAACIARRGASELRTRCLAALQAAGAHGLTDFELAERIGSQQTSAGRRRLDLERAGLVEYAGTKRPAPSGAPARVWRIVEAHRGT